jgi:hypothetical protein
VVERLARAPDDPGEFIAHPPQRRDAHVNLVDLHSHPRPHSLRGRHAPALHDAEVLLDLRKREPDRLRLLDRTQKAHRLLVVTAVPPVVRVGSGSRRRRS